MRSGVVALVFAAFSSTIAYSQAPLRSAQFDAPLSAPQPLTQRPAPPAQLILGGLLGGALGFFGGGLAGALLNEPESSEDDLAVIEGFAIGAVIGETVTLPLGVHIANRRQGNYGYSLLAAAGLTAVGLAFATSGEDHLEYLFPVPVLQLISSVLIERNTTR